MAIGLVAYSSYVLSSIALEDEGVILLSLSKRVKGLNIIRHSICRDASKYNTLVGL